MGSPEQWIKLLMKLLLFEGRGEVTNEERRNPDMRATECSNVLDSERLVYEDSKEERKQRGQEEGHMRPVNHEKDLWFHL